MKHYYTSAKNSTECIFCPHCGHEDSSEIYEEEAKSIEVECRECKTKFLTSRINKSLFEEMVGRTITSISGLHVGSEEVIFKCSDGTRWRMYHDCHCSNNVEIAELHGEIDHLIGSPIVFAYESTNEDDQPSEDSTSWTWTFYRIATDKGTVVLRWLGESDGYCSESVELEMEECEKKKNDK